MDQLSGTEQNSPDVALLTSASQARKWVKTLPITDLGDVTRILYNNLVAINQHSLDPLIRTDITEILLPCVVMAFDNLDRHFSARSFPLPERSQKIFDLKQALQLELANSYQASALGMLKQGTVNQKRLAIALGRAIKYKGLTLVNGYGAYVKSKKNIWYDVHHLYLLACQHQIHDQAIPKGVNGEMDEYTIQAYYKLFNLIALSMPNSLRQSEVDRLYQFFASMVDGVSILSDPEFISSNYAHIAQLDSDKPVALVSVSDVLDSKLIRIFDISAVEITLHNFIGLAADTNFGLHDDQPMLNRGLAKRLLARLAQSSSRNHERSVRDETASIVMRLADVVATIEATSVALNDDDDDTEENTENNLYERMVAGEAPSSPWVESDTSSATDKSGAEVKPWLIGNSHAKGYEFRQKTHEPSAARVGELIAIKDPLDGRGRWQIAVIRWMDFHRHQGLHFGAELLSAKAMDVSIIEATNRKLTQKLPVKGLQLPITHEVRGKPSLVFPNHILKVEDILTIKLGRKKELSVKIEAIDECVGSFAYCEYSVLEQPKETDAAEKEGDFSSLWDVL